MSNFGLKGQNRKRTSIAVVLRAKQPNPKQDKTKRYEVAWASPCHKAQPRPMLRSPNKNNLERLERWIIV